MKAAKITSLLIALFILFIASSLMLAFFYLFIFSKLATYQPAQTPPPSPKPPVSLVICARNELKNLQLFLPSILNQDYPEFEVIIVNDRSTDGSQEWLQNLSKQFQRLRVIYNADEDLHGKRNALKKGIEASLHDIILLTDADCQPASSDWISLMAGALSENIEIVLGYSPCLEQNGVLNRFIQYENFQTALNYLSFTLGGKPYMGVGRNLLYRKSVTKQIGALEHHNGLISGDDDMLVNRIATNQNTAVMIHPMSFVFTVPTDSLKDLVHQKRRHYSTGFHYLPKDKISLGALYFSQIIFNLTLIPLLISSYFFTVTISIFIAKNILQLFIYRKAMHKLNVHNLWIFTPLLDVGLSLFYLTLGSLSFTKIKTWK